MQDFQNPKGESDCKYSIDQIVEIILRDKKYYAATYGGVNLSGGDPLLQDPDSLIFLLQLLKNEKINICAETTLFVPWKNVEKIAPYIDLFLIDFKVIGDNELHKKLTKQEDTLIHSNLKKLIGLKAKIKFRMVMVPGHNDSEANIKAAADYLKSIKCETVELLKYHSMYEEKAKRLKLEFVPLNITHEQSQASIKRGVEVFKQFGIKAENAELDFTPHKTVFTRRVRLIQKAIREAPRTMDLEVSKLKTKYYRKNGWKKPVSIHRAERLAYVLRNKGVKVYPHELLVGNFTSKRVGGQVWEEQYGGLPYIIVLYKMSTQKPVPFKISFPDRMYFYTRIAFYWWNHSLMHWAYPYIPDLILGLARTSEMVVGFNNNMASIAHFIVNFDRVLQLGTTGIIEEIKQKKKEHPEKKKTFYDGAIIGLEALEDFAEKYAVHLSNMSLTEQDPVRRKELEEMAEICHHVPKFPARTFHEAMQSMMFLQIALCTEAYENALSYGRLDLVLYPYYKKDLDAGRITYEKAKELICLFTLKMDECVFVNDGNSILGVNKNFETLSTDQTYTFGGVDKDGNDVTNDVTYMLMDACELQPLAIDPAARVHSDSPKEYLRRLAQIYINGSPQPKIYSDETYIDAIMKHYPVTLEQARNYAIVGCVEPNATDDHFGNTDCANMNLCLPFLQALKGHEHDLWKPKLKDQFDKLTDNAIEWIFGGEAIGFLKDKSVSKAVIARVHNNQIKRQKKQGLFKYTPPLDMDQLIERFQTRLNFLANSILKDHQQIEAILRTRFTTPFSSSLSRGCMNSGKDYYEGGAELNSSGIQALGVTDVADSLYAIDEVVFKKKLFPIEQVIKAIDNNFEGPYNKKIHKTLLAVPKFGDDSSPEATEWVNKVMEIYNNALDSVPNCPRNGRYSAGYYALNVGTRYGRRTQALPSGRLKGVPLANSITPHYGMEENDLLSALNAMSRVNWVEHAENGTTATLTIDSALFQGEDGENNLANIIKTYLTNGGMQLQPNVINREVLLDAYAHPEKHKYLMVRIAGYNAYFNELTDELKQVIINRTYYS
jgi:pyruvate-formate lyase/pyruvate-formate lyase-activating enzyme